MLPAQLAAESFAGYPAQAERVAVAQVPLLKKLPLGFVPLLLRELIVYDYRFPAERRELDAQFSYLQSLSSAELAKAVAAFSQLRLTAALEKTDWVNAPAVFTEQLTAHLWSTHQIDAFSAAAVDYVEKSHAAFPEEPLPVHRLGIVVIGQGVRNNQYRLFRKLRPLGTAFTQVKADNGVATLLDAVSRRAKEHPIPYGHWCIEGSPEELSRPAGVTGASWTALAPARVALQRRMQTFYEASVFDPEVFRTRMAQIEATDIGLESGDALLTRFHLSLLTEGSGTQVFATTFVQWAAREALRRAQPVTLFARFGPRQHENPMNELLAEGERPRELDPPGSLVDADLGAWYTWLNLQRLSYPDDAAFLVWFEDHQEAVAIGRGIDRGVTSDTPVAMHDLIARLA